MSLLCLQVTLSASVPDSSWLSRLESTSITWKMHWSPYMDAMTQNELRIRELNKQLMCMEKSSSRDLLLVLIEKDRLNEAQKKCEQLIEAGTTTIRYHKGLEILKLLYEKVLSLDHHFTSLQTQQSILSLSNPNSFPVYAEAKEKMQERLRKDNTVVMPPILQSNPYFSAAYMLVTSFVSIGESKEKTKELESISCIMDFTMQMHADLNIVFYETEYLTEMNQALKEDCENLFAEYVRPLGYYTSFDICRKHDDWETVDAAIEKYIQVMELAYSASDESSRKKACKFEVDLEFAIDRLMDFINKYEAFVSQGLNYYQKFQVIVNNYHNETVCSNQLPAQFVNLKKDILVSIEKFESSYSMPEIKGSRLKELLYGT